MSMTKQQYIYSLTFIFVLILLGVMYNKSSMWNIFNKKNQKQTTDVVIASEIGTTLVSEKVFPEKAHGKSEAFALSSTCSKIYVSKENNNIIYETGRSGETVSGYRVLYKVNNKDKVLDIFNGIENTNIFEIWGVTYEEKKSGSSSLLHTDKRVIQIDKEQKSWSGVKVLDVVCIPQNRLLITMHYNEPEPRDALYLYDIEKNAFTFISNW